MAEGGTNIGYAMLPVTLSFEGIEGNIQKQLGGVLDGKKLGKKFGKDLGGGLKDLEREVDEAAKSYNKLRDKAADALGKVRVEEEKLAKARAGGKSDQIITAEERLNKARRDSTRAARDASDGHALLVASQKRLADGADDTGRRLGALGASMRTVGTIAAGAALAGITALAAGAVAAGRQLYELGAQFDDLADNLQVKTGLSGAALDKLTDSVKKLGTTNVPSSFAEIGDVAAEVTRNLHLTGQPLEEITSRLANLSRMGQDVDIRSLGKAFRGFGIDVKGQVPALNSLYEASTTTGLSIDDMLTAMVKAGPALRQFGLSFGESAALIATFEDAGVDADKTIATLNKAFAYFAEQNIPAQQGLRDTVARIKDLIAAGDEVAAADLTNKVFGSRGGVNFFELIKSGAVDVESLSNALSNTGLDINQVSDDTADWSEKWQDLKNDMAVALEPVATPLFDKVNAKLEELGTWVTEHQGEVIDFFTGLGEGAISAAEVTLNALAGVVDTLKLLDDLVIKGFSWLPGYDDEAAREFNDSLGDLSDKLNAAADSSLFNDLRDGLRDIGDEAKTAANNTDDLNVGLGQLAGIGLKPAPADLGWFGSGAAGGGAAGTPGQNPLDVIAPTGSGPGFTVSGAPVMPSGGRGGPGTGFGSFGSFGGVPRKVGSDSGLLPQTVSVKDQIATQFGDITDIGGWRPPDGFNEHSSGRAIDVMIPNWDTANGKAYGDQVAAEALKNPNVKYVLWRQTQWNADGTSKPMSDRGSPTQNHMDHVHIYTYEDTGKHPTGTPPSGAAAGPATLPNLAGPDQAAAFGAGHQPSIRAPGVNEYGEPGYFEVDPKNVREAQQRIDDQTERIREADESARQAQVAIDELEVDADQAEKDAAIERKRKADYDAAVARRELADLQGELGEAQQGTFTPAKESKETKGGASGSTFNFPSSFSELAGIALSGMGVTTKVTPESPERTFEFGDALGAAVGGQVSSALGVLGIPDNPPFLQALSTFIGGISISSGSDAEVSPLSASQQDGGAVPPDTTVHGAGGGAAPGPGVVYNIQARDTEDAFIRAQRQEKERAAAKLSRF